MPLKLIMLHIVISWPLIFKHNHAVNLSSWSFLSSFIIFVSVYTRYMQLLWDCYRFVHLFVLFCLWLIGIKLANTCTVYIIFFYCWIYFALRLWCVLIFKKDLKICFYVVSVLIFKYHIQPVNFHCLVIKCPIHK